MRLEIAEALQGESGTAVRMGIHSGPVSEVTDVNGRTNVAGAGINMAQRVMDCGDAGHILLSQHVADDLEQYGQWAPLFASLGECEVKHGVRLHIVNLYAGDVGNPALPAKFKTVAEADRQSGSDSAAPERHLKRGLPWHEFVIALLLLAGLVALAFSYSSRAARQGGTTSAAFGCPTARGAGENIAVLALRKSEPR